jgi:16S rRNA (guanine1516-N2)-methyltransferase
LWKIIARGWFAVKSGRGRMMRIVMTTTHMAVVVGTNDEALRRTADGGGVPVFRTIDEARESGAQYILRRGDAGLELLGPDDQPGQGVRSDFTGFDLRVATGNRSRRQPLGRAIGKDTESIVDATAGLGYDSILLAAMGCRVTAVERLPILAALFEDGLRRALELPQWVDIIDRIRLVVADAKEYLQHVESPPDAIYLDPMFPPKRKAALPPKRIRMVREIVGDDDDAVELLATARRTARRVVVKRPSHAPPVAEDRSQKIETKLVRYDVYVAGNGAKPRLNKSKL